MQPAAAAPEDHRGGAVPAAGRRPPGRDGRRGHRGQRGASGTPRHGTVEFIVSGDRPDDFYFMEMNTRLQVEHPVTEMVTGLDLVEWQLRVSGRRGAPAAPGGDPADRSRRRGPGLRRGPGARLPATGGTVLALSDRRPHVRTDSGLTAGLDVTSSYDPMLAKVIAWAPDRDAALRGLPGALAATAVLGVTTNVAFLCALLTSRTWPRAAWTRAWSNGTWATSRPRTCRTRSWWPPRWRTCWRASRRAR